MIRVLAIADRLTPGGIELMLLNTTRHLLDQGIRVDVCSQGVEGELDAEFEALGCTIHRIPKLLNPYAVSRCLSDLLEREPYNVVHSHKGYGSGAFAMAAHKHGVPVVVSIHSDQSNVRRSWERNPLLRKVRSAWLRWNRRKMWDHADVFVGHSEANLNTFEPQWRSEPHRFRVIQNGVSFPRQPENVVESRTTLGLDEREMVLLHVGTFRPEKNHTGLIEISRRVFNDRGKGILVMVGDGRLRTRIEVEARQRRIQDHVRFEGLQRCVWPYYCAADVFVFPSSTEGFGNALVEAQGVGLPVVATRIPGHLEAVAPIQHRFLFSPDDYQKAANLVLEQIGAAQAGSNDWVAQSMAYVRRRFTVERMAGRLATLYGDLAAIS